MTASHQSIGDFVYSAIKFSDIFNNLDNEIVNTILRRKCRKV